MRRTLAALTIAAVAALTLGAAAPANAVCGGGGPGEPCQCDFPVLSKFIPINC
ncbi:MAG TPA: hypothetical protein VFQ85_13840 [Mycobacteriales bacterium]|jgi:hypothetical protein|nr:hypothetical protein [Mycobacteriales bacterium]